MPNKLELVASKPWTRDLGLLLIRLMVGVVGFFHGSQKLFSLFGGKGMKDFIDFLTSLKVPMPTVSAYAAASAEFFGGILIALGIFPRLAALPFAFAMLVAVTQVHSKQFDATRQGMEYPLTLAIVLIGLALIGPGRFTLMGALGKKKAA